jgi:hypothetical protein
MLRQTTGGGKPKKKIAPDHEDNRTARIAFASHHSSA